MKDIFDDMPLRNFHDQHEDILSEKEQEELRLLLAGAKATFAVEDQDILPNPQIHKNLRAMVAARKKNVNRFAFPAIDITKIMNFKIPAYQVGFAMILVLFIAIFIGRQSGLSDNKNTVVVYKTDTIFEKMEKKAGTTAISKDSQAEIMVPSSSAGLYADSIDINSIDNNSAPEHQNEAPSGLKPAPATISSPPVNSKLHSPGVIDTPMKSGMRLDDTSRWMHELRG